MGRTLMVLLVLGVMIGEAAARDVKLVRRKEVTLDTVEIKGGRLRAGVGRSEWRFRKTPRGTLIYLSSGGWKGWYLSYDHKGKDERVGLVSEPGPGCYWQWSEGPEKAGHAHGPSGNGGPWSTIPCEVRPVNGPLKGRLLSAEGAGVVLTREPAKKLHFTAAIDGPWSYK